MTLWKEYPSLLEIAYALPVSNYSETEEWSEGHY
jgi:hypothetical protein